jgi:hypothetical protein
MSAHTPGPWKVTEEYEGSFFIEPEGEPNTVVCSRSEWNHRAAESRANARLIAASPDLHAELQNMVDCIEVALERGMITYPMSAALATARAALAKAEGK